MTFKSISNASSNFNTEISCNFRDLYKNIVYNKYKIAEESKPSQTFAPSSFRCDRLSFFRLRGIEPDKVEYIDEILEFSAILGTACHREIQSNLKSNIGNQWIDVEEYLKHANIKYEYKINNKDEFETQIEFINPPVKFACDGIIKINDTYYLLEIKTSDYQSFQSLSSPKSNHIDQIKCYCSLLNLHNAIVLYQDRQYGEIKCFELQVKDSEMNEIFNRMKYVLDCVESNIAPKGLNRNDYWCSYCKYSQKCKQWG